jgi:DNA-binding NarL/FixJ family response regulator
MMNEFSAITTLIADRATLFRHGLRGLLKEHRPGWACAEAATFEEVLGHLRTRPVDLLLYDLGIGDLRRLRPEFPAPAIVVLADHDERRVIVECLAAGATGYVLKSTTFGQLLRAVETVLSGGIVAPAALTGGALGAFKPKDADTSALLTHLTDRQAEVFQLLAEGCATKTIARRLGLAVGTVKVHLATIYRVLGAHNRVEALAKARGPLLGNALISSGTIVDRLEAAEP